MARGMMTAVANKFKGGTADPPSTAFYNTFGFNGTDQYVDLSSYENIIPSGATEWTVNTWVNRIDSDAIFGLFYESTSSSDLTTKFNFVIDQFNTMSSGYRATATGSFTSFGTVSNVVINDGWHMLSIAVSSGSQRFYVDAVDVGGGTVSISGISPSAVGREKNIMALQRTNPNSAFYGYLEGSAGQTIITDSFLSSSDITDIYNLGIVPTYALIDTAITNNAVAAYAMNSNDNSLNDLSVNSNNATAGGSVTSDGELKEWQIL